VRRFEGRLAVVTGAASGIGRATALRLASEGASLALVDRNREGAEAVAAELGSAKVGAYACDVSRAEEVRAAAAALVRDLGPPAVLANVAGIGRPSRTGRIEDVDDEGWHQTLAVNLSGPFYWCRELVPGMAERGRGAVVNVSSLAGRSKSANADFSYSASKAGLLGLTRHLAFDYGPRGVRVNAICPGGVDTPMIRAGGWRDAASEDEKRERHERLSAYSYFMPIKRLSTPEEQAAAIAFLASDDASYVNGVSLDVNGGLFMA
jgi:NAD(P)-dependent dehydrogenase (short-subunit alcohol dehydrogenase family)